MKIAVTAATGRLGLATLQALSDCTDAADLRAIARDPQQVNLPGIDCRAGDYNSIEQMTAALEGCDTVVIVSAPVVPGTDRLKMHRNVIAAAGAAGVRKAIYTSVIGNEKTEQTRFAPMQALNRQTEEALQASGLEWIIARNGLYLELDLGHIIRANESGVYQNNGGEGRCGYISITELAAATARLAMSNDCNGRSVNLVSENKTQAELVALANEIFSLNVRYVTISVEQNIARFMADEEIAARGEEVAQMLTGCFECIALGAFDVANDFQAAAGRAPLSIREQFERIRDAG